MLPNLPAKLEEEDAKKRRMLVELATALAIELEDKDTILKQRGISEEEYVVIERSPFFNRALAAATQEWRNPLNTERRIQIQAAWLIELGLPDYYARLTNPNEDLGKVNEGFKVMTQLAGLNSKTRDLSSGEKFLIQINVGNDDQITLNTLNQEALPAPEGE